MSYDPKFRLAAFSLLRDLLRSAGPLEPTLDGYFDREWPDFSHEERQMVVEAIHAAAWEKAEAIASLLVRDDISMDERAAYLAISEAYRAVHEGTEVHLQGAATRIYPAPFWAT